MKLLCHFRQVSRVIVAGLALLTLCGPSFAQQQPEPQPAQPTPQPVPVQIVPDPSPAAAPATTAQGGTIRGIAKSGNMPLPGATVTATNTLTGQKVTTWTDVSGAYSMLVPNNGRYVVRAQMAAFSPLTQEVLINAANQDVQANLEMMLLSRAQQAAAQEAKAASLGSRGFQSLQVMQGEGGGEAAAAAGESSGGGGNFAGAEVSAATESVAVSGNVNNSSLASMSPEAWQQRIEEMRAQSGVMIIGGQPGQPGQPGQGGGQVVQLGGFGGGGFGGGPGGFGGFGGGGGRGGGRRGSFDFNKPHGNAYYSVGDSALNAAPYALAGRTVTHPDYIQQRFGGSIGGPLNIPHIYNGGSKTFFFLNYNGSRGKNPYDQYSTVPTLAERGGDFSALANPVFDPTTNTQFQDNMIPSGDIHSIANGLLPYIPLPNVPGTNFKNFHYVTAALSNSDNLNFRLNRSFGAASAQRRGPGRAGGSRNNLSIGIHYHGASANQTNPFPTVAGSTDTSSLDIPISYTRSFGKLVNSARVDFNRSRISTHNLYAFNTDITGSLGINGVSSNPFDWGLPTLSFGDFGSLQDITPLLQRNQTWTFGDSMIWTHGKHTLRWGGDFRRIELNAETDSNPRGSFVFTGNTTSQIGADGKPVAGTGFDFADFLLGLPQQTAVEYGQNDHFRGNSWDWFLQDEWRLRGNLTFNLGVRYEYVSPFVETNNRIANLDVAPQFLSDPNYAAANAVSVVTPGQAGASSGNLPDSLMRPDRNNFAPRLGLAWKVFSNTVVRAGYSINYNTSAYQSIIQQLAFQPPFSVTQTNVLSTTPGLTLQNGFPTPAPGSITNNYGVDPNYRVGYVQIWNLDIQQQIRPTVLLNLDYVGTKGTALDILSAPNRDLSGVRIATVQAFNWETATGDSTAEIGQVRLRKRLQGGFSVGGTYAFMKALDDASSIGGSGRVVAQNSFVLAAERSLSSFDQKHRFSGDFMWELPFGHDRRWLRDSSPWRAMFGDWLWTGDWTFSTGVPLTPRLLNNAADVNRGTNGTLRPDAVPGQSIAVSNPSIGQWFNTAAFTQPPSDAYGDARRNSIIGPGSRIFNMALTKQIPLRESRVLEFRASAANIFNTPQYSSVDTTLNSPTFGQVIGVGNMRSITLTTRFRF